MSYDAAAFRQFEISGWERKAQQYHEQLRSVTEPFIDPLLDAAGVRAGMRVVDVATGPGYVAARARSRGAVVSACDFAQSMVALATSLHFGIDFRRGDAEALPFADNAFDAVLCNFGLPHFARPGKVTPEFARVAAPGARVALTTWAQPNDCRLFGVMLEAVQASGATPPDSLPPGPPMFYYGDDAEFVRLLEGAELRGASVRTVATMFRMASPDALWNGLLAGGVRMAAFILGQTPDMQRTIRAEYDRLVTPYVSDGRLEIPMVAKIGSGRKAV